MSMDVDQDWVDHQARAFTAAEEDAPGDLIEQIGRFLLYIDSMDEWGDLCRRWWEDNRTDYTPKVHDVLAAAVMLPQAEKPEAIAATLFGMRWTCRWGDPAAYWFNEFQALYRDRGDRIAKIIFRFETKATRQ